MKPSERPRGRDAVRAALLDAAAALFSERGIAAVSVREVAARARVNHGLVHRHFGSKARLVSATLERLVHELGANAAPTAVAFGARGASALEQSSYYRVLAHALLEGHDPRKLQRAFPVMESLVERARAARRTGVLPRDVDPRLLVALAAAAGLGWLVFEPFLVVATGAGDGAGRSAGERRASAALRGNARRLWTRMVAGLVAH